MSRTPQLYKLFTNGSLNDFKTRGTKVFIFVQLYNCSCLAWQYFGSDSKLGIKVIRGILQKIPRGRGRNSWKIRGVPRYSKNSAWNSGAVHAAQLKAILHGCDRVIPKSRYRDISTSPRYLQNWKPKKIIHNRLHQWIPCRILSCDDDFCKK